MYRIEGLLVKVRTTSQPYADWLNQVLADYVVPYEAEAPADAQYSLFVPEASARTKRNFNLLYAGITRIARSFGLLEIGRTLLASIEALTHADREDALYIDASIIWVDERPVLVESSLVPFLAESERRVARSGIVLPSDVNIALDLETAQILPLRRSVNVPADALERLAAISPPDGGGQRRSVEEPITVDLICANSWEEELVRPASRAWTITRFGNDALNLMKLGKVGLDTLARLVTTASCYEVKTKEPREAIDALRVAVGPAA